ncbi:hypothetical protein R078138_01454 [Convivina praedatoris]|nr:hypothetical protein R078138_01454 [Convivina sp. LMG 32447]
MQIDHEFSDYEVILQRLDDKKKSCSSNDRNNYYDNFIKDIKK